MANILPPDMQQSKSGHRWINVLECLCSRILSRIFTPLLKIIIKHLGFKRIDDQVTYYPIFTSPEEMGNHYHRAAWYLPHIANRCESVNYFQSYGNDNTHIPPRPDYMCSDVGDLSHLKIYHGSWIDCAKSALQSRVILIWKGYRWNLVAWIAKRMGISVINIDTEDPNTREYGFYCSLVWKYLLSNEERKDIDNDNHIKFENIASKITSYQYQRSIVLGNGPSLESVFKYDLDGVLSIVCNTTVANSHVMDHVKPDFVAAVDVVSHLGVSIQAQEFRNKLTQAMSHYEFTFVTTTSFGYLFTLHYPEYRDRIILIKQTSHGTNHDLVAKYSAPILDSVLNIIMLPLATTFTREVWLLGCDGKSTTKSNEDFWAHAEVSCYEDQLVKSGHMCHPMFDVHRKEITEERYNRSVKESVENGENKYKIFFRCLRPSNTPSLKERSLKDNYLGNDEADKQIALAEISRQFRGGKNDSQNDPTYEKDEAFLDINPELIPRLTISQCKIDKDGILRIRGWALAHTQIDKIELYIGSLFIGNVHLGVSRPDVLMKHPNYHNRDAGFVFFLKTDTEFKRDSSIRFDMYSEGYTMISRLCAIQ